jgi:hypothetical protein
MREIRNCFDLLATLVASRFFCVSTSTRWNHSVDAMQRRELLKAMNLGAG